MTSANDNDIVRSNGLVSRLLTMEELGRIDLGSLATVAKARLLGIKDRTRGA